MNIENLYLEDRQYLFWNKEEECYQAFVLDAELDEIKLSFYNDGSVHINTEDLSYIFLEPHVLERMQELIDQLNNVKPQDFCSIETIKVWAESLLEKEKEQIVGAHYQGYRESIGTTEVSEEYYEQTYGGNK